MEEIKKLIINCLKMQNKKHLAYQLAKKHDLEDYYIQQCKRYSLDAEKIKNKALVCKIGSSDLIEEKINNKIRKCLEN